MIKRVYIEITNVCNLHCAFCSYNKRTPEPMTPAFFESIIEQVKPITDFIYLHVQGEPLLHPDFDTILSICDEYEMKVQLVTNGSLLNTRAAAILSHNCIRKVSISVQSIEFQKTEPEKYMSDICSFAEKASAQGHPFCEIRFWRTDQIEQSRSAFCLGYLKNRYTFEQSRGKTNFRILPNIYIDFDNEFEWPDTENICTSDRGYCHGAIHQIAILSNGDLVPCCLDKDGEVCFGNMHSSSLNEILSTERYRNMVNGLKCRKVTEPFCKACTFRHRFDT